MFVPQNLQLTEVKFEKMYLEALPCAGMYEKSFMHRQPVTHVAVSCKNFIITGESLASFLGSFSSELLQALKMGT